MKLRIRNTIIGGVTLLLFCLCSCRQHNDVTLRVLSYNIHHGEGNDGVIDLQRIAAIINRLDPDIVAVQEVDSCAARSNNTDQAARLSELTGMHAVFGRTLRLGSGAYGIALLSKTPLKSIKNHHLPSSRDREQRCALDAVFTINAQEFRFIGTHFDHTRDPQDRIAQAAAVNKLISQSAAPVLLAGDLNEKPGGPSNTILMKKWMDSFNILASSAALTEEINNRIDYVMFSPAESFTVVSGEIINEPIASDHNPVLVTLTSRVSAFERSSK